MTEGDGNLCLSTHIETDHVSVPSHVYINGCASYTCAFSFYGETSRGRGNNEAGRR